MTRLPVVVVLNDVGPVAHAHKFRVVRPLDLRCAHPHKPLHDEIPGQRRVPVLRHEARGHVAGDYGAARGGGFGGWSRPQPGRVGEGRGKRNKAEKIAEGHGGVWVFNELFSAD